MKYLFFIIKFFLTRRIYLFEYKNIKGVVFWTFNSISAIITVLITANLYAVYLIK